MRLNRKWLYLGGLVTILTLLLTLTLVLPAGAVGQLDPGSLSTESGYVSPDVDLDAEDRTVTVTLTNSALDGIHQWVVAPTQTTMLLLLWCQPVVLTRPRSVASR